VTLPRIISKEAHLASRPCGADEPYANARERGTLRGRCNRPPGHSGPHRIYLPDAVVVSEWGNSR